MPRTRWPCSSAAWTPRCGKLNDLAGKLGGRDTRVATPSGLDGPGMSTSAYDIGLVLPIRLAEPDFRRHRGHPHVRLPRPRRRRLSRSRTTTNCSTNYPGALGRQDRLHRRRRPDVRRRRQPRRPPAGRRAAARHPPADRAVGAGGASAGLRLRDGAGHQGRHADRTRPLARSRRKPETAASVPAANAAPVLPDVDAMPVRVGVAIVGSIIVFGLIMAARSMNRRPQH